MVIGQDTHVVTPLFPRFWSKVKLADNGECWEWTAARDKTGYGRIKINKKLYLSHRAAYEAFSGEIPEGLQIDHLCRNRWCCNPQHLEAVTRRENILRGVGETAINSRKTHCPEGHPFTQDNLVLSELRRKGGRMCLTCYRIRNKERLRLRRLSRKANPRPTP
jgi:hypothetical protein